MDAITLQRSQLRKQALAARDSLPSDLREVYSDLIKNRLLEYLDSLHVGFVHIYLNYRSEVQTLGIIAELLDRNIKVAVPLVREEEGKEVMIHSLITSMTDLREGAYGIPEPTIVEMVTLERLDAIVMPLVAFDIRGTRLGYGKGFYDRLLAQLPRQIPRIGLAFSVQEMEQIPIFAHDELINNIVTEKSNIFCR